MAKKNDAFYFDNFMASANLAVQAAELLYEVMNDFDPEAIEASVNKMSEIENAADDIVHMVDDALVTAFITPIEREDISTLSNALDTMVDRVEGVLHRIYFTNVREIRPDSLEMAAKVLEAYEQMRELVRELPQFKRSKSLREHVIAVNTLESECDALYINSMRRLHTTEPDLLTIVSWRDVYTFLEFCADASEYVADTVESIIMKNS